MAKIQVRVNTQISYKCLPFDAAVASSNWYCSTAVKIVKKNMGEKFTLEFSGTKERESFFLPYKLMGHSMGLNWARSLKRYGETVKHKPQVRYFAFPSHDGYMRVREKMRGAVQIINQWAPGRLESLPEGEWDQALLNHWHHHFESMIGAINAHQEFYENAPLPVQQAIGDLNDSIHELEMYKYNSPRVNGRFPGCERVLMTEAELRLFSFDRQFGDIVLGYCQLGKQIMDVWIEDDHDVTSENIRPLHHYSPEFEIYLRQGMSVRKQRERYDLMRDWLIQRGYDPKDPKLALGWIVVARLEWAEAPELSASEIVLRINDRQSALRVCFKGSNFVLGGQ